MGDRIAKARLKEVEKFADEAAASYAVTRQVVERVAVTL